MGGRDVRRQLAGVHNSAQPAKDTVTCPGTVPRARGKGQHNFGKDKGPYEWSTSNYDGNKGSNDGIYSVSSHGPVKEYQQGDGKSGGKGPRHGKSYTCAGDHFARDCPKVDEKEDSGHRKPWRREEPPLEEEELTV